MIVCADGRTWCGAVADLRDADVDDETVVAEVRGKAAPRTVRCPEPAPVHERVGYVRPGMGLATRTALAAAGRSRGFSAPRDDELARVRNELSGFDESDVDRRNEDVPSVDADRLRERVAELRGKIQALEAAAADASAERRRLREAARRLSELETERVAAEERQRLARDRRDRRERRLRLQDRAANLERAARAHLVDELAIEYAAAVDALDDDTEDPFAADPVTAALAVCRVTDLRAPVVLAVDRFEDPAAAAAWLDAPVVRL